MVHYLLSWTAPAARLYDITIRFEAPCDVPRLLLPAWRPGRYLMQDYAANVREWSAGGRQIWKDGKTSWRIDARAGDEVTVRYRYYAGVLDAGSSFLDDDEAYFNGSNLFMLVEGLRAQEHLLTVAAPADWRIETQLPRDDGQTFRARDYDHLIDSPFIAAAAMTRHTFVEEGARFHLIFRGDERIDTEPFVEPMRKIARAQAELFGGFPFDEYRFLYHFRDRWHGVEHESSCSIIGRRGALLGASPGDEGFDHLLSISSHELFHAWNVKRIVPARFTPYDYWHETPTRLLWAMEGLTSYFGDLTLVRCGFWSVTRYLEHLRREIEVFEAMPAREHLSLSQASFDGWLADPARMHDQPNAWYSFYNKGELVSLMLDLTIRRASGGERSLDDVIRLLWERYGRSGRGLEEEGMERAVAEVAEVGDFFARYVDGTETLPYDELLATAGIRFTRSVDSSAPMTLGARLRFSDGLLVIDSVVRGGAGMEAGLLPQDELLAVGGTRTTSEAALAAALRGVREGETVELLVARAGIVRALTLRARREARTSIRLEVAEPSEVRRSWLRRDE
jgi:predicted metalloprotease with PDZ domain